MSEAQLYPYVLYGFLAVAVVIVFPLLFFISAPYGRHVREHWGPTISATLGWVLMEAPSPLLVGYFFLSSERKTLTALVFLLLWESHYVHRAFIFPFRRRGGQARMPALVAFFAFCFNLFNAYLNGRWLFHFGPTALGETAWLLDPRFVIGTLMFVAGYAMNQHADRVLFSLRKPGETGYKIPYGGMYRLVSCPNYLGEIIEWSGFALASWSPAGLCFALWTIANLLPRARTNHLWYKEKFPEYPPERRAVIPWIY
jgi:protein-S-isoprenylcysteine O-methyltransferase Ste14